MSRKFGIDKLAEQAAEYAAMNVRLSHEYAIGDSPIEKLFYTSLRTLLEVRSHVFSHVLEVPRPDLLPFRMEQHPAGTLLIQTQVQFEGWRADFVIHYPDWMEERDGRWSKIVVECDGHDFHERTKEQAAKDRSRDRAAQIAGVPILRFTGSELWRDPLGCAIQVIKIIEEPPR